MHQRRRRLATQATPRPASGVDLTVQGMTVLSPWRATVLVILLGFACLASPARSAMGDARWVGVLQAEPRHAHLLSAAGVDRVTLELGWDVFEPSQGEIDNGYIQEQRARLAQFRSAGLDVVLDPGLQYPPSWVFGLPGQTRFINQFGDAWHGPLSEDVPNAVFNRHVRRAQARHLANVGRLLGRDFVAVRTGGLLMNEVRYPPADYRGRRNAYWAFDVAAQARSPVPGWRPGMQSQTKARQFASFYLASLRGYARWLTRVTNRNFRGNALVLLPSWGLRPGQLRVAVEDGLRGRTEPERAGDVTSGQDWPRIVAMISRHRAVAYTTWLDAAANGEGPGDESPVEYLERIATPRGVEVAGENTGSDASLPAMRRMAKASDRVRAQGGFWMASPALFAEGRPNLDDLTRLLVRPAHQVAQRDLAVSSPRSLTW